jgi:nucleoredoxin
MASEEEILNAEIARLEAELEKTRLESKLRHMQAELQALEQSGVPNQTDYLVFQNCDFDEEEEEEEEEEIYEEYEEEEEFSYEEEEIYEEEIEEEVIEDEVEEEPLQHVAPSSPAPTPAVASTPTPASIPNQSAATTARPSFLSKLRKTPVNDYQSNVINKRTSVQKEACQSAPSHVVENHGTLESDNAKTVAPAASSLTKAAGPPKAKAKVRPPPTKGGKPVPRVEPPSPTKLIKKNPLSKLLERNANSYAVDVSKRENAPEKTVTKKVVRKVVPRPHISPTTAATGTQTAAENSKPNKASNGGFTRRLIPNLQPSPPGQETTFEQLLGPKLITNPKLHKCSTRGCVQGQELIGLYFGAVWKSDCKKFNALLKDFYYNVAPSNNLEIVYISADRSLVEFKDVYLTMPFLAMPAGTTELKNSLTKQLKIIDLPSLVILDEDGDVVTVEGVQKLSEIPKGDVRQQQELVNRWKKTRPVPIAEIQQDMTLLHGTMERGTVYWHS